MIGLLRFLDWVMVLLPELEQQLKYELEEEEKTMPYVTSWERMGYARGLTEGREEGREEGEKKLVVRLLQRRFGEVDEKLLRRVNRLSLEQVEQLSDVLFDFTSLQDLKRWLREFGKARSLTV